MSRRVVITGLGAVSPCGLGVDTAWTAVCAGQSCLSEIRSFNPGDYPTRIAGEVAGFDAEALLGKKQARDIVFRFKETCELQAGDKCLPFRATLRQQREIDDAMHHIGEKRRRLVLCLLRQQCEDDCLVKIGVESQANQCLCCL